MSFFEERHGSLLSEEISLQIKPGLAMAIGLNNAIVLQQLRFCLAQAKSGKVIDGTKYIWNTYVEWVELHFPWWGEATVQRIFLDLEKRGLVKSIQPEGVISRKKYYTLKEGAVRQLTYERMVELRDRRHQLDAIVTSSCDHPEGIKLMPSSTESSTKTSAETSQPIAPPVGVACLEVGKSIPKEGTPSEPKKEGKRNELLDTLARIDGADPLKVPRGSWSKYNKVLSDIKTVVSGVTPDILLRAAKTYRRIHPTWELTATALASHWGECYTDEKPEPQKILPEPVGWKEFVDKNMPDCPYAFLVDRSWSRVNPEHQAWISTAILEESKKQGVA